MLASLATRDLARDRGWRRLASLGALAIPAAAAAAVFDAIEDVWLLIALDGHGGDLAPMLAAICAVAKFALAAFAVLYLAAGLVLRIRGRGG